MAGSKVFLFLVAVLAVLALLFYIFSGNLKNRLWRVGMVVALTFVLFRFVLAPLGEMGESKFLGEFNHTTANDGTRFVAVEDTTRVRGLDAEGGEMHPVELIDSERGNVLVGADENYWAIEVRVKEDIVLAKCYDDDAESGENRHFMYILKDGNVLKKYDDYFDIDFWRGNIIKVEPDIDADAAPEYYRTDGEPLTMIQKVFISRDALVWGSFLLSLLLAVLVTAWLFRNNKMVKES